MKKTVLLAQINWKTTILGIGVIITAVGTALQAAFDGDASTVVNYSSLFAEIQIGLALILARDSTS